MTVNELLQKLVELAADGKAQYEIRAKSEPAEECHCFLCSWQIDNLYVNDKAKEVVIE